MKTTLVAIIGDWNGGNNGQFPILLEYDPSNMDKPFISSKGWGHGYGGNNYTLDLLNKYGILDKYNQSESYWAFAILKRSLKNGDDSHTAGMELLSSLAQNKPKIPTYLKEVLNRNA